MNESSEIPGWMRGALVAGLCCWLLWRELRRPARGSVESKLVRTARNLAVAALGGLAVQFAEMPMAWRLSAFVQAEGWGLLKLASLPVWLETLLAVLALDYTLYHWHVLTHRQALLWRFHLPHHADRDMDASTALRFHFGEIGLSVGWRAAQIAVIGVSPLAFSIWQTFLILCILFHHSNVRLSPLAERRMGWVLVTPTMHAIHHSNIEDETNSNWSSGLSFWDRFHGTLRLDVPLDALTMGIPAYASPEDVTLTKVVKMPFVEQRPDWQLPDGSLRLTRRP